jgi:hypothetical protein
MTQEDQDKLLTYYTMCQALIHIIEDEWQGNPANRQTVKNRTSDMLKSLKSSVEILLPRGNYSEEGMKATEHFVNAAEAMINFYKIGYKMARLDDTKRDTLNNQINLLLKSYEIL